MALIIIFALSGICIVILVYTKIRELKHERTFFPLNFISKSDHRIREVTHLATRHYSELKEKGEFVLTKQLPLHSKNILNKTKTLVRDKVEKHLGDIRNTRLLGNKKDGISEFFKNLSDKENGNTKSNIIEENVEVESNSENL